ncbi:MAG: hypothetical protein H6712_24105 [Myxococcales bacterium]|nr:hypothetical protein [Myxococcales bacterium]MCB9716963.1 hypothetical protein [Myxococcales bacterium]
MHGARLPLALVLVLGCGPRVRPQPQDETTTSDATAGTDATGQGTTPTTGTSSVVTTGLDSSGSDTTGNPFIADPDFGGCGGGRSLYECSLWAQDCCPGEKCMPWANDGGPAWNASRCSPIDPEPGSPGDPCEVEGSPVSGLDTCELGSMCWNVDIETLQGECIALCSGDERDPQCPPGTACQIANDGYLILCLERCDPLAPDCAEGEACIPIDGDYLCLTFIGEEPGPPGDPCDDDYNCAPDGRCAPMADYPGCATPGCCTPYCDHLDGSGATLCAGLDPAMICEPVYPMGTAPEGLEHLGTCRLP